MSTLTDGDKRLLAFVGAVQRSQQLITGALLSEGSEQYEDLLGKAQAIAQEWGFTEDLREAILELAYENTTPTT